VAQLNSVDQAMIDDLFWWLCDGAPPSADARQIVGGICEKLTAAGVPVHRFALFIYTLHPNIRGRRFSWTPDNGLEVLSATFSVFTTEEYHNNPLPHVIDTKTPVHRKLCDPDCPEDYKILAELKQQGYTDYMCQPLVFTTGEVHVVSYSTKTPGGYDADAVAALERVRLPLARLTETYMLRLNAATLLSTYVGRNCGAQILHGRIRRGDTDILESVILFADLKNFTETSNRLGGKQVIELLNYFFDAVGPSLEEHGGEILKFMGDGLLAIFPIGEGDDVGQRCEQAVAAVVSARARLKEVNLVLEAEGLPAADFRCSLHVGDIHYGNIGSANRLDFTAIGPGVNLAARLLAKASSLGEDVVVSQSVAAHLAGKARPAGKVDLRGFDAPQPAYSLSV
jgi:adenylate cyclase